METVMEATNETEEDNLTQFLMDTFGSMDNSTLDDLIQL
jgi:hypothetical protein